MEFKILTHIPGRSTFCWSRTKPYTSLTQYIENGENVKTPSGTHRTHYYAVLHYLGYLFKNGELPGWPYLPSCAVCIQVCLPDWHGLHTHIHSSSDDIFQRASIVTRCVPSSLYSQRNNKPIVQHQQYLLAWKLLCDSFFGLIFTPFGVGRSRRYCDTGPTRGQDGASPYSMA